MCKKLTFLVSFALVLSFFLSSVTKGADPNLVGWWKLNEVDGLIAYDSSGNGNTGTLISGPVWVTGAFGSALSFDGTDDYVNCGNANFPIFTNKITLTGWVKTNRAGIAGTDDPIVQKGD